jgi:hypothetical protein
VFVSVEPRPGSSQEPNWLRELRKVNPRNINWTQQDDEAIVKIRDFEFRVESMTLNFLQFWVDEGRVLGTIDDKNEVLLILEGLDWK